MLGDALLLLVNDEAIRGSVVWCAAGDITVLLTTGVSSVRDPLSTND